MWLAGHPCPCDRATRLGRLDHGALAFPIVVLLYMLQAAIPADCRQTLSNIVKQLTPHQLRMVWGETATRQRQNSDC